MLKVIAWYDNEYGYANRLVEQTMMVGTKTTTAAPAPVPVPEASVPAAPPTPTQTQE